MSDSKNPKFTIKAVINKEKTRVLFAEIDNNFADLLLSFSTLPLGIFVKHYVDKAPVIGSLNNLVTGLTKFRTLDYHSEILLCKVYAYQYPSGPSRDCFYQPRSHALQDAYFWVLKIFEGNTSFFICDDLRVVANGKGSILDTLNNVGVAAADMDGAETRDVTLGVDEVMDFLVRSLISSRPLTDIVLATPLKSELANVKSEAGITFEKDATSNNEKMILKATFQKSTNKFLFVQTDHQFVDYLYSLLRTPLGRVDSVLGCNTCFDRIHILYKSSTGLARKYIEDENFKADAFFLSNQFQPNDSGMYMINDDFTITRLYLLTSLSVLDELKISLSDVEELEFQIGFEEVLSFLRTILTSTRALTDFINSGLKIQQKPKQEQ